MSSCMEVIMECLCGSPTDDHDYLDEKRPTMMSHEPRTAEEIAKQVVHAILRAEKGGKHLQKTLDDIVGIKGWTESLAEWILVKLEKALQKASEQGPVVKDAYNKAWEVAKDVEGFVLNHPVFCTVIALGVLVLIAPWAIAALGFGELGPVEGSFAAFWQARYGAMVPKGSLFSFFQRLGMKWG